MSAVSHEEFICKLKSGRGEKRESQRQSNLTPDFEGSVWNVSYAQLSIQKLPVNKRCGLDGGRKPQNISELNQVGCAAGTMVHETAFPKGSLSLGKSRSKLFHSCSAIGSETHWARSSVSTLELHNLCSEGIETHLSSALFHLPICYYFLEMEESALALSEWCARLCKCLMCGVSFGARWQELLDLSGWKAASVLPTNVFQNGSEYFPSESNCQSNRLVRGHLRRQLT